jgi:ribonuclease HII
VAVGAVLIEIERGDMLETLLSGIRDSKKLSPQKRREWVKRAKHMRNVGYLAYTTALVGVSHIDASGIVDSVLLGIKRSLSRIASAPEETHVLLDGGLRAPRVFCSQETIIRGDEREPLIALASILAKVRRDDYMARIAERYPEYRFETHKGYGTDEHKKLIRKHGLSLMHRRDFVHA